MAAIDVGVPFVCLDLTVFDCFTEEVLVVSPWSFKAPELGALAALLFAGFLADVVLLLATLPLLGMTEVVVGLLGLLSFFGLPVEVEAAVEVLLPGLMDVDLDDLPEVDMGLVEDVEMVDDEDLRVDDVEVEVEVEVNEVFDDEEASVGRGRAGAFSPAARLTYVLNRHPAPQYSVLLPAQVMLQSESDAIGPLIVLPV